MTPDTAFSAYEFVTNVSSRDDVDNVTRVGDEMALQKLLHFRSDNKCVAAVESFIVSMLKWAPMVSKQLVSFAWETKLSKKSRNTGRLPLDGRYTGRQKGSCLF